MSSEDDDDFVILSAALLTTWYWMTCSLYERDMEGAAVTPGAPAGVGMKRGRKQMNEASGSPALKEPAAKRPQPETSRARAAALPKRAKRRVPEGVWNASLAAARSQLAKKEATNRGYKRDASCMWATLQKFTSSDAAERKRGATVHHFHSSEVIAAALAAHKANPGLSPAKVFEIVSEVTNLSQPTVRTIIFQFVDHGKLYHTDTAGKSRVQRQGPQVTGVLEKDEGEDIDDVT